MGPKVRKIAQNALETVKKMPKSAILAAIIVPGGFIAAGIYIIAKNLPKSDKNGIK